jgi:hypothetical protein
VTEQFKIGEQFQKVSKEGSDAVFRAHSEANKGLLARDADKPIERAISKRVAQAFTLRMHQWQR